MAKFTFSTEGICSKEIKIDIENGIVVNVDFESGCEGNLQGIRRLIEGMRMEEVIRKLRGIDCEGKGTSCPDQLAKALEEIAEKHKESIA